MRAGWAQADLEGMCQSAIRDNMGPVIAWIFNAIAWSAEKGARNFLYSSTQPTMPGAFIHHCRETPVSTFVVSPKGRETQEKYWKECLDIFRKLGVDSELDRAL